MKPAQPKFSIGETVVYTDHQGREQTGAVMRIEARWWQGGDFHIGYTVRHPTYRNRLHHCHEEKIAGIAS